MTRALSTLWSDPGILPGSLSVSRLAGRRPSTPAPLGTLADMDRPAPDPRKLLDEWMEWERGETSPGRVMGQLKTGGLRDLLEAMVADLPVATVATPSPAARDGGDDEPDTRAWTPVV